MYKNYSLQQILFTHTGGEKDIVADGVLVISRKSSPDFFNKIGNSNEVWDFLDSIRQKFQV
jgi:predicted Rdx family selenoprotein